METSEVGRVERGLPLSQPGPSCPPQPPTPTSLPSLAPSLVCLREAQRKYLYPGKMLFLIDVSAFIIQERCSAEN